MSDRLRILALEPYYGGSHRAVLDGLIERVDAEWTLLALPARKWKWRMRGAAITMAEQARAATQATQSRFDLVFASTFLNLAEFRGLAGPELAGVPAIVYFHENQLVYPNRHTADWDFQFPLTNITSALSAECCLFNTGWNLDAFIGEIPGFMAQFPDHRPQGLAERVAAKARVLPPPFDPAPFDAVRVRRHERCRIVWPHRWEHDKNPRAFFDAVGALASEGLDFEVAVAGQSYRETAQEVRGAAEALGDRLVHCEEPSTKEHYADLLASSDVAVSTADNEFFGIAMVEACYAGCAPLVPDRLAYPEIYPRACLYAGADDLVAKLRERIVHRPAPGSARAIAECFTFERLVPAYAAVFEEIAGSLG